MPSPWQGISLPASSWKPTVKQAVPWKSGQRIREGQKWHVVNPKASTKQKHFRVAKLRAGGWEEVAKRSCRSMILSEPGFNPKHQPRIYGSICTAGALPYVTVSPPSSSGKFIKDTLYSKTWARWPSLTKTKMRGEKKKRQNGLQWQRKGNAESPSQQRTQRTWMQLPAAQLKHLTVSISCWKQPPRSWNAQAAKAAAEPNVRKEPTWNFRINIILFTGGVYSSEGCWGTSLLFLTLFSIGKTFIFATICWKSLLCLSPRLHSQIPPPKFAPAPQGETAGVAWTWSYDFLLVLKERAEKPPPRDRFGSTSITCRSHTSGAEVILLASCSYWGSWQTQIRGNAGASWEAWQSAPLCALSAHSPGLMPVLFIPDFSDYPDP